RAPRWPNQAQDILRPLIGLKCPSDLHGDVKAPWPRSTARQRRRPGGRVRSLHFGTRRRHIPAAEVEASYSQRAFARSGSSARAACSTGQQGATDGGWQTESLFIDNNLVTISQLTEIFPEQTPDLGLEIATYGSPPMSGTVHPWSVPSGCSATWKGG